MSNVTQFAPRAGRAPAPVRDPEMVPHAMYADMHRARLGDQRRYFTTAVRLSCVVAENKRLRALLAAHGIDAEVSA